MRRSSALGPRALLLAVPFIFASAVVPQPATVTVNTTSGAVDGNTDNIALLNLAPGAGGAISLMEAIAAANNTQGPKRIAFSTTLMGKTIPFGSNDIADLLRFSLKGSDLTIDGDVDGNGTADVTLDAAGKDFATLHIRASNVTISNLIFREFGGQAINFACDDVECTPHAIANVRIAGNTFESQRGGAVEIGVWGLLGPSNLPLMSKYSFSFENIVIDRNTVRGPLDTFADGIGCRVCSDGVANSRYTNIYVTNNYLSINVAIDGSAADEALPPYYSDNCVLDHFTIDGNVIEDASIAVYVDSANLGNQHNVARHIRITNNRIVRARQGLRLGTANLPNPTRSTSFNVMTDLLVSGNEIADSERAILLSAGNWPLGPVAPTPVDDNTLTGVTIAGNNIHGYRSTGMQVFGAVGSPSRGGHTSSRNRIEDLTIAGNTFEAGPGGSATGLEIIAGQSNGGGSDVPGIAADNEIRGVRITGNTFRAGGVALSLKGGVRAGATGNLLSIDAISANTFEGNGQDVMIVHDAEGAAGNRVELPPKRRSARH